MAVELTTIARPYAEAIFDRAKESGKLDQWAATLGFLDALIGDPDMTAVIVNPKIDKPTLEKILLEVASGQLDSEGENLVKLLTANGRLAAVGAIRELFEQLKSESEGVVDVLVVSAYAVQAAEKNAIAEMLKARLGKEVNITTERDPALIGGVRIRAGDLVIDGSVQGRLKQLANEFGI